MPEITKHVPGTLCWADLATSDPTAAKAFYGTLFGWSHQDDPMGEGAFYTRFLKNGLDVCAGFGQMREEAQAGIPPHWNAYLAVEDVDAAAGRVGALGGKVLLGPMDVFDAGRMAFLQDPTGAVIGLWQAKQHVGARVMDEPETLCWVELLTGNVDLAGKFYVGLLGWKAEADAGGYTVFKRGDEMVAGMMAMPPHLAQAKVPPHWGIYFAVADCDETVKKAASLGARTLNPPTDVPNVGRFAVLQDAQGAVFSVIKLQAR